MVNAARPRRGALTPNPSLQPTRYGLRPSHAAKLNRWASGSERWCPRTAAIGDFAVGLQLAERRLMRADSRRCA